MCSLFIRSLEIGGSRVGSELTDIFTGPSPSFALLPSPSQDGYQSSRITSPHFSVPTQKEECRGEGRIFPPLAFLLSDNKIFLIILPSFTYISLARTRSHAHPWVNYYQQGSDSQDWLKSIMIHPLGLGTFPPEQKPEVYQQERRGMVKKPAANSSYIDRHNPSCIQPIASPLTPFALLSKGKGREWRRGQQRLKKYSKGVLGGRVE